MWDPRSKEAIRAAFEATGAPFAADAFRGAQSATDAWAQHWQAMRRNACEATLVRGDQTGEVMQLHQTCLEERLLDLRELARLWSEPDRRAVEEAVLGNSPKLAAYLGNLSEALLAKGDVPEALRQAERAVAQRQKALPPEHPDHAGSLLVLGRALARSGRSAEAVTALERAVSLRQRALGASHPLLGEALAALEAKLPVSSPAAARRPQTAPSAGPR
ncbi:MAG: tetratricopeptide repeat protein [Myxococcaceae bacterium]